MHSKRWITFTIMALFALAGVARAATVTPGAGGIASKIEFKKADLRKNARPVTVQATVSSIGWCDPAANPQGPSTSFDNCYGNAGASKWYVLDFSRVRRQGVRQIAVDITARQAGDINAVPALTVWQGQSASGVLGSWYPNKFQTSPAFWASGLAPFTGGSTNSSGWSTAYSPTGGIDNVSVTGNLNLLAGRRNMSQNALTVAVGSDQRKLPAQPVNLELVFKITKPVATTGAGFDACGCPAGTLWHPEMNHCMATGLCDLPEYKGQCQTGAACTRCGGKRPLPGGICP